MSIIRVGKKSNRQFMMHCFYPPSMAFLTNSLISFHNVLSRLPILATIFYSYTTLPARAVFSYQVFRRKAMSTLMATKGLFMFLFAPSSNKFLTTPITYNYISMSFIVTYPRTIFLCNLLGIFNLPTTTLTKYIKPFDGLEVTFVRTVMRIRSTINRVKCFIAEFTNQCDSIISSCFSTHTYIIPQTKIKDIVG